MPVVSDIKIESARLVVWKITETTDELFLLSRLSCDEHNTYKEFGSESRKLEWLAVRALIREFFGDGVSIKYNNIGAPQLLGNDLNISVSHTNGYVAVLFSDEKCGVDIELKKRDFSRVAKRFVGDDEKKFIESASCGQNTALGVIWCTKESMYKRYGMTEIDFIKDMKIISMDDTYISAIFKDENSETRYFISEDYIIALSF